ncbi:hypothetical protein PG993_007524 [Apiospora rasikravindrae]|uniref:Type 1 phosphatases regulator n=1 Tax=Apiospora rasikravindrae TaxID=990691 RepID=A0ABR1SXR5_9PEZI
MSSSNTQPQQQQRPGGGGGNGGGNNNERTPGTTSQTVTIDPITNEPILRLRGGPSTSDRGPRVQWAEGTVDNEGLGRKSSKVCCIYHKPREVGESSSEDDSSSSSSSDSDSDSGHRGDADRVGKGSSKGKKNRGHKHDDHDGHDHDGENCDGRHQRHGNRKPTRRPSPNAYEKQPKPKPKPQDGGGGGGGGPSGS